MEETLCRAFRCPSSQGSPVSKRVCKTSVKSVDQDLDCVVTQVEPCQDMVVNPPDREWKEEISREGRRWIYYPPLFYDEKKCREV